jgi:hypothetical protein
MGAHEFHYFYATDNVDWIKNDYKKRGSEEIKQKDLWNLSQLSGSVGIQVIYHLDSRNPTVLESKWYAVPGTRYKTWAA